MDFAGLSWLLRRMGLASCNQSLMRPAKGDGEDGDELRDALVVRHMGVFEIEAAGLHGGEQGLDFPAQGVGGIVKALFSKAMHRGRLVSNQ